MKHFLEGTSRSDSQTLDVKAQPHGEKKAASSPLASNNDDQMLLNPHLPPAVPGAPIGLTSGLQPKYSVSAVPHPYPHDHLVLVSTKEGLLIRPQVPGKHKEVVNKSLPLVRIKWRKEIVVEEMNWSTESHSGINWASDGVVVYGIVGVLELYSCASFIHLDSTKPTIHRLIFAGNHFQNECGSR